MRSSGGFTGKRLDVIGLADQIGKYTMTLDPALRRAIRRAPCTIRALAREARVSHVMLVGIVTGRERATSRVALKVAKALERWGARCVGEAAAIRAAVEGRSTNGGRMMKTGRRKA